MYRYDSRSKDSRTLLSLLFESRDFHRVTTCFVEDVVTRIIPCCGPIVFDQ